MISVFVKGLIIGIIVSAPIGPIGLLCAQRTLSKGRAHGYATAIGATISDLFYAIIAVCGMSFVVDFINDHQFGLRLGGCAAIFLYGLYTYINNPVNKLNKIQPTKDYIQDCLSSFGLTITNPLVILLFIALFAKFNYVSEIYTITNNILTNNILAVLFILIGAALWWMLLVNIISYFRGRFNIRGMGVINRGTGIILMVLSVGVFLFWAIEPYFS
ncbi:MAG: LysE family translocator [Paludibacteraceae bacterium]|nr:LysE family transporter [Paludibacteraceae bacterium]MBR6043332.1 LysE family transporter [Paludibacteraceae bacterium]MCR5570376.1 LysE family translocator [Paludibacteraceae bacterium]